MGVAHKVKPSTSMTFHDVFEMFADPFSYSSFLTSSGRRHRQVYIVVAGSYIFSSTIYSYKYNILTYMSTATTEDRLPPKITDGESRPSDDFGTFTEATASEFEAFETQPLLNDIDKAPSDDGVVEAGRSSGDMTSLNSQSPPSHIVDTQPSRPQLMSTPRTVTNESIGTSDRPPSWKTRLGDGLVSAGRSCLGYTKKEHRMDKVTDLCGQAGDCDGDNCPDQCFMSTLRGCAGCTLYFGTCACIPGPGDCIPGTEDGASQDGYDMQPWR
jgi:hypothetical protein